ncbi:MCE family protein [bacterium]|nr:MCE family protein [bacterium]
MKSFSVEAKVGLFVLLAFIIIVFLTLKLGDFSFLKPSGGYTFIVRMNTAGGLEKNAKVLVSGVQKGKVLEISLSNGVVDIRVMVDIDALVREDALVQIKTRGLMGAEYLEFIPSSNIAPIAQNGHVFDGSAKSIGDLQDSMGGLIEKLSSIGDDVKAVSSNLKGVLGTPEGGVKIQNIVDNIEKITKNLDQMIRENRENLKNTIDNASSMTGKINSAIPDILENLKDLITELKSLVADNKGNITDSMGNIKKITEKAQKTLDSIDSIAEKIDKGEGTIGKLINRDTIHDNLDSTLTEIKDTLASAKDYFGRIQKTKLFFGYRAEYLTDISKSKNYVSIRIQPDNKKFYYAALMNDPYGNITIQDTNEIITTNIYDENDRWVGREKIIRDTREETNKDRFKFSLQYGYNFFDLVTLRGGLFESEGGVGIDFYYKPARTTLSFEAWDFGDDEFDPHLKLLSRFNVYKGLFFLAGYDNFLNSEMDEFFLGGGIVFEDDDLKYLLGQIPIPNF